MHIFYSFQEVSIIPAIIFQAFLVLSNATWKIQRRFTCRNNGVSPAVKNCLLIHYFDGLCLCKLCKSFVKTRYYCMVFLVTFECYSLLIALLSVFCFVHSFCIIVAMSTAIAYMLLWGSKCMQHTATSGWKRNGLSVFFK